ncbi:S8 family peptidase [Longispora urticae]
MDESLPLVRQPEVAAADFHGAATSVAVIDTGVDYTNPAFGQCSSAGPACRVAYAQDFPATRDDGRTDDDGHSTNVAGIVLSMAQRTRIISLDVFQRDGARSFADDTNVIAAVNWVVGHQVEYGIAAINLSLGDDSWNTQQCRGGKGEAAFRDARQVGVVPVVAAGNDAYHDSVYQSGVSWPACVPGALTVGAVYDSSEPGHDVAWGDVTTRDLCNDRASVIRADRIACFSQGGPLLDLLAPGAWAITVPAIDTPANADTKAGTSQAAPHVAGAVAVLSAAAPFATLQQITTALTSTGPMIRDDREAPPRWTHRLDLAAALTRLRATVGAASWTHPITNSGTETAYHPDGAVTIADGCATDTSTYQNVRRDGSTAWTYPAGENGYDCLRLTTPSRTDGRVFTQLRSRADNRLHIAALNETGLLWINDLPEYGCPPPYGSGAYRLTVGADGNVYALINATAPDCGHQDVRLVRIDASTGAIGWDSLLGPMEKWGYLESFGAYDQGITVSTITSIIRVDYQGHQRDLRDHDPATSPYGGVTAWNGRHFTFLTTDAPEHCDGTYGTVVAELAGYDPHDQQLWTTAAPRCAEPLDLDPTPDGGAVAVVKIDGHPTVIRYDNRGRRMWSVTPPGESYSAAVAVDDRGHVVVFDAALDADHHLATKSLS